MSRSFWCASFVLLSGLIVSPVVASTFLTAEFREIVTESSTIVRGRVTDVRAVRTAAGEVESVVTIAVDSVLKGPPDETARSFVSMWLPGGTIGRYRTVMTGAPTMRVGQQALFFLRRGPTGALWPVGLSQGIYRVVTARSSGLQTVSAPVMAGVTTNATGRVVRGDVRRKTLPVSEFESLVRLAIAVRAQ
ncbi:MAG: hypothetical protein HQ485_16750 [Acidobacteria bacterium]|nr:hypothetical protein [Acidobacteriota bacterium]